MSSTGAVLYEQKKIQVGEKQVVLPIVKFEVVMTNVAM